MKYILNSLIIIITVSCTNSQQPENKFESYLKSLNKIQTPIELGINSDLELSKNFNDSLFKTFKHIYSFKPVGILYNSDTITSLLEFGIADNGLAPFLMTYGKNGNKIDSLNVLKDSGWDQFQKTVQFVKFKKKQIFTIIDTTTTWKYDSLDNIIQDSTKIKTQQLNYLITPQGKIKKVVNT